MPLEGLPCREGQDQIDIAYAIRSEDDLRDTEWDLWLFAAG